MNTFLIFFENLASPGILLPAATYGTWKLSHKMGLKMMYAVYCIALGLLFGPSLLGVFFPLRQMLFPHAGVLSELSHFAVNCMCFLGGIEIMEAFRLRMAGKVLKISIPTILAQAAIALALTFLLPLVIPEAHGWFLAIWVVCCTIALPMLMSALMSLGWMQTRLGRFSMVMSAYTEVCLWIGVIIITVLSGHASNPWKIAGFAFFSIAMFFIVRPILQYMWKRGKKSRLITVSLVIALFVLSPQLTDFLGFHAVIGAVGAGLVVPLEMQSYIHRWKLDKVILYWIAPFFLLSVGFINAFNFSDVRVWVVCIVLIATSALVQMSLTGFLAHKIAGFHPREALALGCSVTNKGVVEIVLSTILVGLGVISLLLQQGIILSAVILIICSPLAAKIAAGKDDLPKIHETKEMKEEVLSI